MAAVREGVSLEYLFERALIAPQFDDDRDRISSAQLALLYYHANQATEDEGRRNSAARIPLGFGTLAARALFGHSTLEAGLAAMAHLSNLTSSALRIAVRIDHDDARLVVYCEDGRDGADTVSLEDAYLSFLFMCVSHFLMRTVRSASSRDLILQLPTTFTLGFSKTWGARSLGSGNHVILGEQAFGTPGFGGSLGFADGEAGLAFGYVMNRMGGGGGLNARGQGLVDAAYRAVGYRTSEPGFWVR